MCYLLLLLLLLTAGGATATSAYFTDLLTQFCSTTASTEIIRGG